MKIVLLIIVFIAHLDRQETRPVTFGTLNRKIPWRNIGNEIGKHIPDAMEMACDLAVDRGWGNKRVQSFFHTCSRMIKTARDKSLAHAITDVIFERDTFSPSAETTVAIRPPLPVANVDNSAPSCALQKINFKVGVQTTDQYIDDTCLDRWPSDQRVSSIGSLGRQAIEYPGVGSCSSDPKYAALSRNMGDCILTMANDAGNEDIYMSSQQSTCSGSQSRKSKDREFDIQDSPTKIEKAMKRQKRAESIREKGTFLVINEVHMASAHSIRGKEFFEIRTTGYPSRISLRSYKVIGISRNNKGQPVVTFIVNLYFQSTDASGLLTLGGPELIKDRVLRTSDPAEQGKGLVYKECQNDYNPLDQKTDVLALILDDKMIIKECSKNSAPLTATQLAYVKQNAVDIVAFRRTVAEVWTVANDFMEGRGFGTYTLTGPTAVTSLSRCPPDESKTEYRLPFKPFLFKLSSPTPNEQNDCLGITYLLPSIVPLQIINLEELQTGTQDPEDISMQSTLELTELWQTITEMEQLLPRLNLPVPLRPWTIETLWRNRVKADLKSDLSTVVSGPTLDKHANWLEALDNSAVGGHHHRITLRCKWCHELQETYPELKSRIPLIGSDIGLKLRNGDISRNSREIEKHAAVHSHQIVLRSSMENHLIFLRMQADFKNKDTTPDDERIYGKTGNVLLLVYSAVKQNIAVRGVSKIINVINIMQKNMNYMGHKQQTTSSHNTMVLFLANQGRKTAYNALKDVPFSFAIDASTDNSNRHFLITYFMYCDPKTVSQKVLFYHLILLEKGSSAEEQWRAFKTKLKEDGLWNTFKDNVASLVVDGASVNVGSRNSLASRIKAEVKRKDHVLIHVCPVHKLALAIKKALEDHPAVDRINSALQDIHYIFFNKQGFKARNILKWVCDSMGLPMIIIPEVPDSRWLPHAYDQLIALQRMYLPIAKALVKIVKLSSPTPPPCPPAKKDDDDDDDDECEAARDPEPMPDLQDGNFEEFFGLSSKPFSKTTRARALRAYRMLNDREFALWFHALLDILSPAADLTKSLQSRKRSIPEIALLVDECVEKIRKVGTMMGREARKLFANSMQLSDESDDDINGEYDELINDNWEVTNENQYCSDYKKDLDTFWDAGAILFYGHGSTDFVRSIRLYKKCDEEKDINLAWDRAFYRNLATSLRESIRNRFPAEAEQQDLSALNNALWKRAVHGPDVIGRAIPAYAAYTYKDRNSFMEDFKYTYGKIIEDPTYQEYLNTDTIIFWMHFLNDRIEYFSANFKAVILTVFSTPIGKSLISVNCITYYY